MTRARKPDTDGKGYSLSPRQLKDGGWFYEDKRGIIVLQRKDGITTTTIIPWARLELSVDHHRELKAR